MPSVCVWTGEERLLGAAPCPFVLELLVALHFLRLSEGARARFPVLPGAEHHSLSGCADSDRSWRTLAHVSFFVAHASKPECQSARNRVESHRLPRRCPRWVAAQASLSPVEVHRCYCRSLTMVR
jgi:hypothetical protein